MSRTARALAVLAALLGALAVMAGAFGAHALRGRLDATALGWFDTAVRYQMFFVVGLFAAAWLAARVPRIALAAGVALAAATLLFCGSLYAIALGAPRGVAAAAPLGGALAIGAWLALAVGAWRAR